MRCKDIGNRKQREYLNVTQSTIIFLIEILQLGIVLQRATDGLRQMLLSHKLIQTLHLSADARLTFDG